VIPFYYEVKEVKMWVVDFCKDFFLTFIYQYIAFKTRKKEYLDPMGGFSFQSAAGIFFSLSPFPRFSHKECSVIFKTEKGAKAIKTDFLNEIPGTKILS
jgi:hypothetical protein